MRGRPHRLTFRGKLTILVALAVPLVLVFLLFGPKRESLIPNIENIYAPPEVLLSPPVAESNWTGPESGLRVFPSPPGPLSVPGPLFVEYTFSRELMQKVFGLLSKNRVALGHIIVMEPESGKLLAYASTNTAKFAPQRTYPAASLVKVVTTAAALEETPEVLGQSCIYNGDPYRLRRRHIETNKGRKVSLRKALALSYNQCFARLAVHHLGSSQLLTYLDRFGLLESPALAHEAGLVLDPGVDKLALGKLGSGLDGLRITPLHGVRLAATLARGRLVTPWWVARVEDGFGQSLKISRPAARLVLSESRARKLREMLADTTKKGTARRAFRTRRGKPLLQGLSVAAKTGSLSGSNPSGRYEWFVGVAPVDRPRVALAVLVVQGDLYWASASQLAAEVLKILFCPKGVCSAQGIRRFSTDSVKER